MKFYFYIYIFLLMSCGKNIKVEGADSSSVLNDLENPVSVEAYLVANIWYGAGYVAVATDGDFLRIPKGSQVDFYSDGKTVTKRFTEVRNIHTNESTEEVEIFKETVANSESVQKLSEIYKEFSFEDDLSFVKEIPECTSYTDANGVQSQICFSSCVADGGSVDYTIVSKESAEVLIYKNDGCGNFHVRENREDVEVDLIELLKEHKVQHSQSSSSKVPGT